MYDVVTVLILSLAGTSVVTALSNLLPRFLFRFGMELAWSQRWGVLLFLFGLVNVLVTLWFQASVDDQRGAYATAVLVLFTIGAWTRVTSILSLVVFLSDVNRAPMITGLTEPVVAMLLLYLCLAPCGRYFSLDRRLAAVWGSPFVAWHRYSVNELLNRSPR